MEKRIFAAIAISIAFLWLWAALAPKLFPELAKPKSTSPVSAPAAKPKPQEAAAEDTGSAPMEPETPISATKITYTVVDTPDYTARFSNRGAQLVSFRLTKYKARTASRWSW